MLGLRTPGRPAPGRRATIRDEVGAGLVYIWTHPVLRALFAATFLTMLFGMPLQFLMPAFNQDALDGGPDDLGLLMGSMGVGAIVGSLVLARMGEVRRKGWWLLWLAVAWAVFMWLFAGTEDPRGALPLVAVVGLTSSSYMSMNMSLIQLTVEDAMRGRVMSVMMMTWGLMPIGVVPISFLAEAFGIGMALATSAAVLGMVALAMMAFVPAIREREIDTGYEAPEGAVSEGVPPELDR